MTRETFDTSVRSAASWGRKARALAAWTLGCLLLLAMSPFQPVAAQTAQAMVPPGLEAVEARDASAFVSQIAANPVQSAWPEELFRPVPGKHSTTHAMPLPDGKTGEVSVEIEADGRGGRVLVVARFRS